MRLWRRHDAYVTRAFWGAFGAVLLFFTLIFVLIDMAERLKQLNRYWERVEDAGYAPLAALARFYATMIPFVWLRIIPLAAPMAGAFALARLARHQELVPLVGAGVSTRRVLLPVLLSGALLAGLMVAARATVVPALDREHQALGRLLTKRQPDRVVQVPHVHDAPGVRLSAAAFLPIKQRLDDAWITRQDGTAGCWRCCATPSWPGSPRREPGSPRRADCASPSTTTTRVATATRSPPARRRPSSAASS